MIDSCIRGTRSSERQQAWKGVNQLSRVVIWRTARLWLEFSIRTSTIHHATRQGGGCISSSALPAVGIASSKALKRGNLKAFYLQKGTTESLGSEGFSGTAELLLFVCILKTERRLLAAQPFSCWKRKRGSSSLSSCRYVNVGHLSEKEPWKLSTAVLRDMRRNKLQHESLIGTRQHSQKLQEAGKALYGESTPAEITCTTTKSPKPPQMPSCSFLPLLHQRSTVIASAKLSELCEGTKALSQCRHPKAYTQADQTHGNIQMKHSLKRQFSC